MNLKLTLLSRVSVNRSANEILCKTVFNLTADQIS
jgi:hypothetical protein